MTVKGEGEYNRITTQFNMTILGCVLQTNGDIIRVITDHADTEDNNIFA